MNLGGDPKKLRRENLRGFRDLGKINITLLGKILEDFTTGDSGVESFASGIKGERFRA